MPPAYIAPDLRKVVEDDAQNRCGYCLTPASFMPVRFEVEHIIPDCLDGEAVRDNLWLSCPSCNRFKGIKVEAVDPDTQIVVPLFNPRTQDWFDHFQWSEDSTRIIGRTAIGRATVEALKLNYAWWADCRAEWALRGNFPPAE